MTAGDPLTALRRQLAGLSYDAAGVSPASAPLVAALLADLVKASDSYRARKEQAGNAEQTAHNMQYQVEALRSEVARLGGENNRLHHDLLAEAEARAAQEAAGGKRARQLEAHAADLELAKQQAVERAAAMERERDGLRGKVRDLLSFRQQHVGDELALKAAYTTFACTAPLEPRPAPAALAKTSRGGISLLRVADTRIASLEAAVRRQDAEAQDLQEKLQQAQDGLARREAEIARLSGLVAAGPDVDRLAQQHRTAANEAVVLQLNQQVELLTGELSELQRRAVDRGTLEAAQQAQQQAEARASALAADRESVAREVEVMQAALVRLQQEAAGEGAARQKLGRLRATLEAVRNEKALLEGQLTRAESKVAELRDRLEQREAALRKLQNRHKQAEAELAAARQQHQQQQQQQATQQSQQQQQATQPAEQQDRASQQAELAALAERLRQANLSGRAAEAAVDTSEAECRQLRERVAALEEQLHRSQHQFLRTQEQVAAAVAAVSSDTVQTGQEAAAGSNQGGAAQQQGADQRPETGSANAGTDSQQQAGIAEQLERMEFERNELLVRLQESEARAEALAAAASGDASGQSSLHKAAAGNGSEADSSGSGEWLPDTAASGEDAVPLSQEALQQLLQARVEDAEGKVAKLQTELAAALAARENGGTRGTAPAAADVAELQRQLRQRSQEVFDLSALSIRADATVQQYMAQLRGMATELKAAELRLTDAEAQLARSTDEAQRSESELAELRRAAGALDAERTTLQAELHRSAEGGAAEAAALRQRAESAERALAITEDRLAASASRLAEQEQLSQQQQGEMAAMAQQLAACEAEYQGLREEYRAVTEDLSALAKDNQLLSGQLSSMTAERHELAEQVKLHSTRSHYSEQLARTREQESAELRTAYEGMSHEAQRLQQSLAELTRELQARDAELVTRCEEVSSLHEAQRSAQSQINLYISDLQAYERQVAAMQRAMQRGDEAAEGLDRERHSLLEQLRTAEQVRFQLERAQEALQRQLVAAEGGVGVLEARLADAVSDSDALRQRIGLEQARVGELEGLLAVSRAEQYKRDAVAAEAGPERFVASLSEQKRLLEEQVATLQRQVDGLVQRREAQDAELAQLRSRLAAEFEAGGASASRASQQQGEELGQRLLEAQQQCSELGREAHAARGEAAQLQGMRNDAVAALHAAQAELEDVKGMLRRQQGEEPGLAGAAAACSAAADCAHLEQNEVGSQQQTAGSAHGLESLKDENERLLALLAHMDGERTRLARERQELQGQLEQLQAAGDPNSIAQPGRSGGGGSEQQRGDDDDDRQLVQLQERQRQLEWQVEEERQRRQQVEQDFQLLLSSMDAQHVSPPSPGSPAAPSPQHQAMQLQAAVSSLQNIAHGLSSIGGKASIEAWAPQATMMLEGAAGEGLRLTAAFNELRSKHKILVEEDAACCGNCGHSYCEQLLYSDPEAVGYLFYHNQDIDRAAEGRLYLGHSTRYGLPAKVAPLVAKNCLEDHGFEVYWDGDVGIRIWVHIPEGPERDYFQHMHDSQWADYDEEEMADLDQEAEAEGEKQGVASDKSASTSEGRGASTMEPHQAGLWAFMRRREALMTSPGLSTAADEPGSNRDAAAWQKHESLAPAQVPTTWDPQAHWLQPSPATPAPPAHAAIATAPHDLIAADTPASEAAGSSSKPRGFAAVWGKLKATFSRSSKRGRRRGGAHGSNTGHLGGRRSSSATPASQPNAAHPSSWTPPVRAWFAAHNARDVPPPPPERQPQPSWPMQYNVLTGGTSGPAPPQGRASSRLSLPGRLQDQVPADVRANRHSMADGSFPEAAPHPSFRGQQQQDESCMAWHEGSSTALSASLAAWGTAGTQLGGAAPEPGPAVPPAQPVHATDSTVRRLVFAFSPQAAGAGSGTGAAMSRGQQLASHPIPIANSFDRARRPAADWRLSRDQQQHQTLPPQQHPQQQQQPAAWPPARRQPAQSFDEWRRSLCLPAGAGGGERHGFVTPRLSTDVLADYTNHSQYHSSRAGGGPSSGTAASSGSLPPALAELLAVPRGLAGRWLRDDACGPDAGGTAAISESEGQLALQWITKLTNGAAIRRPAEVYPKSGALATVPRLDGRGGSAAAQLAVTVDGSVCIKALQGPPLAAVVHRKLTLSASGERLRASLKVQLLEEAEGRRRSMVGGRAAKQVTYWRRAGDC
ncbi:Centrosomal protein [Chlorella vulgaris]